MNRAPLAERKCSSVWFQQNNFIEDAEISLLSGHSSSFSGQVSSVICGASVQSPHGELRGLDFSIKSFRVTVSCFHL